MPTQIYKTKDGKRVPSVTGISKMYGDNGGLIYWANQQGLEGKTLQDAYEQTATPGSMAHERVDFWIKGLKWDADPWKEKFKDKKGFADGLERSNRAFDAFLSWASYSQFKLISGEVALISEKHKYPKGLGTPYNLRRSRTSNVGLGEPRLYAMQP